MEDTKKVGASDPTGPQGLPSAGNQQLRSSIRGSQESSVNSGSLHVRQGLSLFTETTVEGSHGSASQTHTHEPIHQLLQNSLRVTSQGSCEQASQNVSMCFPNSPLQRPVVRAQPHLIMDDGTPALPVCTYNDSNIRDPNQYGPSCPRFQAQVSGECKAPSKVLVGWGKGSCISDQMAPVGPRKSRWPSYIPSKEDEAAVAQGSLASAQLSAQTLASTQSPGKCPCPAQVTTSSMSLPPSAPAQATTSSLDVDLMSIVIKPYTCTLGHLTDTIAIHKNLSQDLLLRKCNNQWSTSLKPSKISTFCENKMGFQEAAVSAAPTASDYVQEHKVARRQELPEQPEHLGEKLLTRPHNTTPDPEHQGTPKPLSFIQESCSSQSDQQPLNIHNHICASVSLSAYQGTYHRQPPGQSPTVVMQMPSSGASTCQHQEAMEDRVLVFDMATGNTRVGLLCHEPMDSQAMLVGMVPKHPCICIPKSMQPMGSPIQLPDSPPSNFWSTSPMLSSPVPSSLSPGSYREVSLLPKEAKFNLETQNTSGPETPIRLPVHTGPVSLGMPLQFGEKILTPVSNTGWSKPDAEKNEPRHILWPLDTSKMPDGPMVQSKKLQWVTSEKTPEPDLSAKPQEVTKVLVQEHTKNQNQEKVISVHAEDPAKVLLTGQPLLAEQLLLARKIPPDCQHSQADQPPSIEKSIHTELTRLTSPRQPPLPDQPLLTGKLFLTKHVTFTEQFPFSKEPICAKEPVPLKGLPTTREPGQAATLCQEGESLGLPTHVAVLQMPLDSEKTCVFVKREKVSCGTMQSSSTHQMAWQQDSSSRAQEEQLSLMTFAMPDTGCKVLPISVVGTEPQGAQFKMKAGDVTHSSVVTRLGLLQGNCNELLSSMDALPVKSAGICCRLQGPCQNMAAIVIDTGTGFTKCGLAGEDHVLSVVPSRVQLLQHSAQGQPRYTIPENQEGACPVLTRGVVSDWDALEVLWQHLFYCRLGVQPEELAVLVADSPVSPRTNREKVAELLFEHFHVPAMQTVHQALLTLYSYGRTTGLVLGSGYGTSYVTPILTGDLAPLETHRLDVAGCDLTEYLAQLLLAGGHSQLKTEVVNKIKEACCYVISDMSCNQAQAPVNFVLPDKQVITLGSECFCCPEALFQPSLLGLNQPGLSQLALQSISCLEAKQQEQLLANVVLDGGSTLLNGFPERLRQELGPCATVLGSPHRAVTAWLGGSIMASRDSFQSLWLSRCQYEEEGSRAIYKYHL